MLSAQGVAISVGQMGSPGQGFWEELTPAGQRIEGTLEWIPKAFAPSLARWFIATVTC